ncbi:MAG TPA: ATP-binding protein [Vicinamibacterales bacterium]|jgi:anti-sigma regulatory factor (Ser/Thr protein kinase)
MTDGLTASVTVPGRIESVRPAVAFLVEIARGAGVAAADNHLFEVAIVEAISNALKHNVRDAATPIHCELEVAGRLLCIRVLDEAARAPLSLAMPTGAVPWSGATAETIGDVPESGYGLYLMRAVFPEIAPVTREGRHGIELKLTF